MKSAMTELHFDTISEPGLHLMFPDGFRLHLTRKVVEEVARQFLSDETKIPARVKAACDFAPCEICPKKQTAEICHAILPVLPFLEKLDRYFSYDKVTVVYRGSAEGMIHVSETTMQRALQYVSILSLIQYCETGKKYAGFFAGVIPMMDADEIAECLRKNIFWSVRGDRRRVDQIVQTMRREILTTTQCQVKRLRLVCKRDAFINAFVNTQMATEVLDMDLAATPAEGTG